MITQHPSEELKKEYATGRLAEPMALAVASHMALCEYCSAHGEELTNCSDSNTSPMSSSLDAPTKAMIPEPLRPYLSHNVCDLPWQEVQGGIEEFRLSVNQPDYRVSLVRLKPGYQMPTHTHDKEELTVILDGGLTDGDAHLERGDFVLADSSVKHSPLADPNRGCIALGVLSGPIQLAGWMGTLFNPLLRF